jgi:cytochrome c553
MHAIRHLAALIGLSVLGIATSVPSVALTEDEISVLAGPCANCHGPGGRSAGPIASLAGRPEALLRAQLRDFKAGKIPNATVMQRLSTGYTDEQLDALARYFSNLKPKGGR